MGCGQSKVEPLEGEDSPLDYFLDDIHLINRYPFNPETDDSPQLLLDLCDMLSKQNLPPPALDLTIEYLLHIASVTDNFARFDICAKIMLISQQIWHLNDATLRFFHQLNQRNPVGFAAFFTYLKRLQIINAIQIKADHIHMVVHALLLQSSLPTHSLDSLEDWLIHTTIDVEAIIQGLRPQLHSIINDTARGYQLMHHHVPHALEIRTRTLFAVTESLQLLNTESQTDRFIKTIAAFMIEFHDLIQKRPEPFETVEIATASVLMNNLGSIYEGDQNIHKILEYMSYQIIVLGTTMLFSPHETIDLSRIFLQLEDISTASDYHAPHRSNLDFLNIIKSLMLVTGVVDKNPAAVYPIVHMQLRDKSINTFSMIQHIYPHPLLERFFESGDFHTYFGSHTISRTDIQAFFIALVPHFCMRAELSYESMPVMIRTFIHFIDMVRKAHALASGPKDFSDWYQNRLESKNIVALIDVIFFQSIEKEVMFCRSQVGGLNFVKSVLYRPSVVTEPEMFIESNVPLVDAENLLGLQKFYKSLGDEEKRQLVGELLLSVVYQAGHLYTLPQTLTHTKRVFIREPEPLHSKEIPALVEKTAAPSPEPSAHPPLRTDRHSVSFFARSGTGELVSTSSLRTPLSIHTIQNP